MPCMAFDYQTSYVVKSNAPNEGMTELMALTLVRAALFSHACHDCDIANFRSLEKPALKAIKLYRDPNLPVLTTQLQRRRKLPPE